MLNFVKRAYLRAGNFIQYAIHKYFYLLTAIIITVLSLVVRFSVALHPTKDVVGYVFSWMQDIQEVGFTCFYTVQSDYSPLFLFIIAIYTLLPTGELVTVSGMTFYKNWMYYVKSTYFVTEIIIAVGIYLLIKQITNSKKSAWLGYVIFLCLPVQLFNSAIWGNSDTMYFACFVYALLFVVKQKSGWAFFVIGVGLGLKLQSIFIFPLLVYLVLSGKIKFYKIYALLLGLFATFIPAYIFGASIFQPFAFWERQLNGYNNLTLGCANIWHLINIKQGALDIFNQGSTWFGLLLIGLFTAIVFSRKVQLASDNLLLVSVFLIAIVPMFLPHMHERYFYALDVLIVVYCLIFKRHYFLVVLMQLSSGIAYHNYLAGRHFILSLGEDSVHIASWINIFVLAFLFYQILKLKTEGSVQDFANKYKALLKVEKVNNNQESKSE